MKFRERWDDARAELRIAQTGHAQSSVALAQSSVALVEAMAVLESLMDEVLQVAEDVSVTVTPPQ